MISFSGLATGLDTASLIDALMAVERQPINRLEATQSTLSSTASKFKTLRTQLTTLKDAVDALADHDLNLPTSASSSDEGVFTATVTGSATVGSTSIHVDQLATAEKTYSDGFSARDQTGLFGTGTLSIQVGTGTAVDVSVDASDTLDSVVSKINSAGAGVTAGIVYDGSEYRLRVTGNDTGAENALTFTETGLSLNLDEPGNQIEAAQDAQFVVDGFLTVNSASNVVDDAIPGVSLTLVGESSGATTQTLDVNLDTEALRSKLQTFVNAYNEVNSMINAEFTYTPGSAVSPTSLSGDSTLRGIQTQLRSLVGDVVSGTSGAYTTLRSIGVESDNTGALSINDTTLDAALADDPQAIATLLGGSDTQSGFMDEMSEALDLLVRTGDGVVSSRIDSIEGRSRGLDDQIARLEVSLDKREESLRNQFAALEELVSNLQFQGNQLTSALAGLSAPQANA